jgi:hypothetical protein
MASIFTLDYHEFTDENIAAFKSHFTDEEFVELGAFMAHAHGFGVLVEALGLGGDDQACEIEI